MRKYWYEMKEISEREPSCQDQGEGTSRARANVSPDIDARRCHVYFQKLSFWEYWGASPLRVRESCILPSKLNVPLYLAADKEWLAWRRNFRSFTEDTSLRVRHPQIESKGVSGNNGFELVISAVNAPVPLPRFWIFVSGQRYFDFCLLFYTFRNDALRCAA